jgi:hypothetical protein
LLNFRFFIVVSWAQKKTFSWVKELIKKIEGVAAPLH